MSEVDEAMQAVGRTTMAYLTAAFAVAQMASRERARRLQESARQSDADRRATHDAIRAEADLQAARWEAARRQGVDWVEAYASALAWRDLDPRAERAASAIDRALRDRGWPPPGDDTARAEVRAARDAAGWQVDADEHTARGAHADDRAGDPRSDTSERAADASTAGAAFSDAEDAQIAADAAADTADVLAADINASAEATSLADTATPTPPAADGNVLAAAREPGRRSASDPADGPSGQSAPAAQLGRQSHPQPVGTALAAAARGGSRRTQQGRTPETSRRRDRGRGR